MNTGNRTFSRHPLRKRRNILWMQHRMQTKYVRDNFLRMHRPLAYKSPLEWLKSNGQADIAHELFYDQPELISTTRCMPLMMSPEGLAL